MNTKFWLLKHFPVLAAICIAMRLNDVEDEGNTSDKDWQKKALGSLDAIQKACQAQKTSLETVTSNLDRVDKDTKKALEDLELMRKSSNESVENLQKQLKSINALIQREVRSAHVSPIQRISKDEELRTRFNCAIRMAMDDKGDIAKHLKPQLKALGEDTSPGSTLINTALLNEIYDTLATYGVWNTFGVRNMGTKITKLPVKTARPIANFILTEGDDVPDDTNKAGTSVDLEVEMIAVLLKVSMQLMQDAEFDVTADVLADFAEAYAYRLDYMAMRADGTSDVTNGGFTGAFVAGTAAAAAAGNISVETLDYEDFIRCLTTVDAQVLNRGARWWIHPQMLARVLAIKDLNGRPIFQNALEAPALGGIGSILGYPVTLAMAAPNTNSTSSKVALFGDPDAQVVGIRSDYVFESSDHFAWNSLQRTFRGWGRAGTKNRKATGFAVLTTAAS